MSYVTSNQPDGTPTWIDLGIPDLDRAMEFYRALFGWEFQVGGPETGHYTICLVDGRPVAALLPNPDQNATAFWWNVYFATADCDATVKRLTEAGGTVLMEPMDVMEQGRMAMAKDPTGAQFGLWQGRAHIGCQVVNEPNTLARNDLVTPRAELAREFYKAVFGYSLDANPDMPDTDFTFLRRPDGHEIGGIVGDTSAPSSTWTTFFEVADTDAAVATVTASGGTAGEPEDNPYVRLAPVTDPFGTPFMVGARPAVS